MTLTLNNSYVSVAFRQKRRLGADEEPDAILLEDGDHLLQESGDKILIEETDNG